MNQARHYSLVHVNKQNADTINRMLDKAMEYIDVERGITTAENHHLLHQIADDLAELLRIGYLEEWYIVLNKTRLQQLCLLLPIAYNCTQWHHWKFEIQNPSTFSWKKLSNQREYFDWLEDELGIYHFNAWYSIEDIEATSRYGAALSKVYSKPILFRALPVKIVCGKSCMKSSTKFCRRFIPIEIGNFGDSMSFQMNFGNVLRIFDPIWKI
jgi:hypothetical protein